MEYHYRLKTSRHEQQRLGIKPRRSFRQASGQPLSSKVPRQQYLHVESGQLSL